MIAQSQFCDHLVILGTFCWSALSLKLILEMFRVFTPTILYHKPLKSGVLYLAIFKYFRWDMAIGKTVYWVGNRETVPVDKLSSYLEFLLLVELNWNYAELKLQSAPCVIMWPMKCYPQSGYYKPLKRNALSFIQSCAIKMNKKKTSLPFDSIKSANQKERKTKLLISLTS